METGKEGRGLQPVGPAGGQDNRAARGGWFGAGYGWYNNFLRTLNQVIPFALGVRLCVALRGSALCTGGVSE